MRSLPLSLPRVSGCPPDCLIVNVLAPTGRCSVVVPIVWPFREIETITAAAVLSVTSS